MKKTIYLTQLPLKNGGVLRVYRRTKSTGFTNEHHYCAE